MSEPSDRADEALSPWIIEADEARFQEDVLDRSYELPIVLDFWAAWCQPCRMLGPVLEQLAREYDGAFLLVKADTDRCQQLAASFRVQGIPAVYALRDGKIVDQFVGLKSEDQLREWLDRLQPTEAERLLAEARSASSTDPARAITLAEQAITADPRLDTAKIFLAETQLSQGNIAAASELLAALERRGYLEPEAETLKAQLDLKQAGSSSGNLEELRAQAAAAPQDLSLSYALAQALAAAGNYEEALKRCLELVQQDRHGLGEQARKTMVDIFHLLGSDNELTSTYRRQLSAALY